MNPLRVVKLLRAVDKVHLLRIPTILVTGSNGKGTTCAFTEAALRALGYKTGLFTSPHIDHPCERMRLDGMPVTMQQWDKTIRLVQTWAQAWDPDFPFFAQTLVASLLLGETCDVLVCEAGIGGRHDATNILAPQVSAVVSVSKDHTEILGETLFLIAQDKAFVGRRNKVLVIGDNVGQEAQQGIEATAQIVGCRVQPVRHEFLFQHAQWIQVLEQAQRLTPPFCTASLYKGNLRVALQLVSIFARNKVLTSAAQEQVVQNLATVTFPGRFEIQKKERVLIWDAAHNPGGVQFFYNQYRQLMAPSYPQCVILFATLKEKNIPLMLELLQPFAAAFFLTSWDHPRAYQFCPSEAEQWTGGKPTFFYDDFAKAWQAAYQEQTQLPLVSMGSIAFLGALRAWGGFTCA